MQSLFVIESRGQRVLTSAQIADCYNTTVDCIKQNFHANRSRYVEGKHYIALTGSELKEFKNKVRIPHQVQNENENEVRIPHSAEIKARYQFDTQFKYAKSLYLWTEKGALLHAKSLNTDKAWEVYDYLVDFYFRAKEQPMKEEVKKPVSKPNTMTVVDAPENPEILKIMEKIQDDLICMKTLVDGCKVYLSEDSYRERRKAAADIIHILVADLSKWLEIKPNLIQKYY